MPTAITATATTATMFAALPLATFAATTVGKFLAVGAVPFPPTVIFNPPNGVNTGPGTLLTVDVVRVVGTVDEDVLVVGAAAEDDEEAEEAGAVASELIVNCGV